MNNYFNPDDENNTYQGPDPYSSMNPPDPFNNMNQNPVQPFDPYNLGANNYQNTNMQMPNGQGFDPSFNQNVNTPNDMNSPILPGQDFNSDFDDPNAGFQNNSFNDPNAGFQNNGFNNPNAGFQNNGFDDPNAGFQNNGFNDPNAGFQNNGFNDPNAGFQNNGFNDPNAGFQNNGFNDPNAGFQDNGFNNPSTGFQDNGFSDPNLNYQNAGSNTETMGDYNSEFVKNWMGPLYEKATKSKINWCALLFGEFYLLYRKMYVTGSLFLILRALIIVLLFFLVTKIGLVSLIIMGVVVLLFNIGYGFGFYPLYKTFIKGNLTKLKNEIPDNSQLINIASQKGGTSTIAAVISGLLTPVILGGISAVLITTGVIDFENVDFKLFNKNKQEEQNVTGDQTADDTENLESYYFAEGYVLKYDDSWFFDEDKKTLNKGDYVLKYSNMALTNIKNTFGFDVTIHSGKSQLLNFIIESYRSQVSAQNISIENASSNFSSGNNTYYAYVDLVGEESVSRYYLILLPEKDLLFQFVLTINNNSDDSTSNTSIEHATHIEVINLLTSIEETDGTEVEEPDDNTNEVADTNVVDDENVVDENTVDENSVEDENVVDNETSDENTVNTNSVNSTVSNSTVDNTVENDESTNTVSNSTLSGILD